MVFWNSSGRTSPSRSWPRPITSPSRIILRPGNVRTSATRSTRRAVMSLRFLVYNATSSPSRWTWRRAPSSFHSTLAGPSSASSASPTPAAVDASIGCTGRPTVRVVPARPAAPRVRAMRAAPGRLPASIAARRTAAAGTPAALATASAMTPPRAPWRSPPVNIWRRNSCSAAVAAAKRAPSTALRVPWDPAPTVCSSSSRVSSSRATVSVASAAAATCCWYTLAQPTPMRPWRGSPVNHAATGAISSGSNRRSSAANASILARRLLVAATAAEVPTTSASRVPIGVSRRPSGAARRSVPSSTPIRGGSPRCAGPGWAPGPRCAWAWRRTGSGCRPPARCCRPRRPPP